jgi:adenylate kinase
LEIVLIGPTGSGKTTLANHLHETLQVPVISTGAIARRIAEEDPDVDAALRQGLYGPEQRIRDEVRREIERCSLTDGGYILEGFPRKIPQLICLMQWSGSVPHYIHLAVDEYTCINRLVRRARPDDTPDGIAEKLSNYRQHTIPMLEMVMRGGKLHQVDAKDLDEAKIQAERILR